MTRDAPPLAHAAGALVPLAALPAAPKLAAAFLFALSVSFLSRPGSAAAACVMPLALALLARAPLRRLARRLAPVSIFCLLLWLLLPLGQALGTPMRQGVELAALVTLKSHAVAAMLLLLPGTSNVSASCRGLLRLRVPDKLVTLLLLTHANLARLHDEHARLAAAARLRGAFSGRLTARYATAACLAAMLLVRAWERTQRVKDAMRLRGFAGRYPLLDTEPAASVARTALVPVAVSLGAAALLLADATL